VKINRCFLLMLFFCLFWFYGCEERPNTNTEKYLKLHGIVNGQEKEIKIGKLVFFIPPEIDIQVETYGEINKGEADILRFDLDFSHLVTGWSGLTSKVRVVVRALEEESVSRQQEISVSHDTRLEGERMYFGLIEQPTDDPPGGWSFKKYIVPLEDDNPTIGNMVFNCSGRPETGVSECWGGYKRGMADIWLFLSGRLLPNWRQVILETDKKIEFMIRDR